MTSIILVFGNVQSRDYGHLRLAMHRAGLNPKILPLNRFEQEDDLFTPKEHDKRAGMDDEELARSLKVRVGEMTRLVFSGTLMSEVRAIVMPMMAEHGNPDGELYSWLIDQLPEKVARYKVRASSDGSPNWLESVGSGKNFGSALPPHTSIIF